MKRGLFKSLLPDEGIVIGVLLAVIAVAVGISFSRGYYLSPTVLASQVSGYGAFGLLAISILFGPLLRAMEWFGLHLDPKISARISKNTGIASAVAALAHFVLSLTGYLKGYWRDIFERPYLYAGLLALCVFMLLLVASVKPLTSWVRWRLWKPTFRLSFAAAVLVSYHMVYAPFTGLRLTLGLYAVGVAIFLLRFVPRRARD